MIIAEYPSIIGGRVRGKMEFVRVFIPFISKDSSSPFEDMLLLKKIIPELQSNRLNIILSIYRVYLYRCMKGKLSLHTSLHSVRFSYIRHKKRPEFFWQKYPSIVHSRRREKLKLRKILKLLGEDHYI